MYHFRTRGQCHTPALASHSEPFGEPRPFCSIFRATLPKPMRIQLGSAVSALGHHQYVSRRARRVTPLTRIIPSGRTVQGVLILKGFVLCLFQPARNRSQHVVATGVAHSGTSQTSVSHKRPRCSGANGSRCCKTGPRLECLVRRRIAAQEHTASTWERNCSLTRSALNSSAE